MTQATDLDLFDKVRDLNALELEGVRSLNEHEQAIVAQLNDHRRKTDELMQRLAGQVAEGYGPEEIIVNKGALYRLKDEHRKSGDDDGTVSEDAPEPETGEDSGEDTTQAEPTPIAKAKPKRRAKARK